MNQDVFIDRVWWLSGPMPHRPWWEVRYKGHELRKNGRIRRWADEPSARRAVELVTQRYAEKGIALQ